MYPLTPRNAATLKQALSNIKASTKLWHYRLGHPSSSIVHQVLHLSNVYFPREQNISFVCNACQMTKSHQLTFSTSNQTSSFPLDLIHSDVWGPAITSVNGFKYYVSFIDDYSKFTWLFPLKYKSEVEKVLYQFQAHVERLLNRKILCTQTDWDGECRKIHPFFKKVGIEHHVSYPHTHQQNGSGERKYRHVVEVGLSLLAHASMPLKFWNDAFKTACFLINRLPSRVINSSTPLEKLLGTKPDYSFLRKFGCVC